MHINKYMICGMVEHKGIIRSVNHLNQTNIQEMDHKDMLNTVLLTKAFIVSASSYL